MHSILANQKKHNRQSRRSWDLYASHRKRVTDLLCRGATPRPGRLIVLGAGNCNDLDLAQLAGSFSEVHLADLDRAALEFGRTQQPELNSSQVQLHGDIDVTGVCEDLARWNPQNPPSQEQVALCARRAVSAALPDLPAPFDVAASVCLLTQLTETVALAVGERHPRFVDLMLAVRNRHLRMLVELTKPGGRLCLVTDVVSSVTYPGLAAVPDAHLSGTVSRLIQDRNFFTGANPFVLHRFLDTDSTTSHLVDNNELIPPWRWDFGPRVYAVCAICARRKSGAG